MKGSLLYLLNANLKYINAETRSCDFRILLLQKEKNSSNSLKLLNFKQAEKNGIKYRTLVHKIGE